MQNAYLRCFTTVNDRSNAKPCKPSSMTDKVQYFALTLFHGQYLQTAQGFQQKRTFSFSDLQFTVYDPRRNVYNSMNKVQLMSNL